MDLYLVTGASRGLGEAIATLALKNGNRVVTISRSKGRDQNGLENLQQDLRELSQLPDLVKAILEKHSSENLSAIHLINNAGAVEPIDFSPNLDPNEVAQNIQINLTAPIVLANAFLRETAGFQGRRSIVNISSGVAENPKPSWATYSAAKAGLRAYTLALAQEFSSTAKTRILSFSPGIMDTEMQAVIRGQSPDRFPEVEKFRGFQEQGKLLAPEKVAATLIALVSKRSPFPKWEVSVQELL